MQNCQVRTIKAQGRVNSRAALSRLEQVLDQLRELHDACLYQHRLAEKNHEPKRFDVNRQQKELTLLQADSPEQNNLLRRLQGNVIRHTAARWNKYLKESATGRPRYKTSRFRTIALDSPQGKVMRFTASGKPVLHISSLPAIRLLTSQEILDDRQPRAVRITLKGGRIQVRLSYQFEVRERQDPTLATSPIGVDLGIALSVATSTGQTFQSPKQLYLQAQERKYRRKLNRIVASAMATGTAGFRAVLDADGSQMLTRKGRPMRELVWTSGKPAKAYLKARRRLSEITERLALLRREFRHRVTTSLIEKAAAEGRDLLAMEDLQVRNMTASARGTVEKPGRNVRAKSGLNRAILHEAWGETLTMLEYKAERAGIPSVRVNAQATSITCSCCGHKDPKSRNSQSSFKCTACHYQANADSNASLNIADRGMLYFQKRKGLSIESLRQARRDAGLSGGTEGPDTGPAGQPASQNNLESPTNASKSALTGPDRGKTESLAIF